MALEGVNGEKSESEPASDLASAVRDDARIVTSVSDPSPREKSEGKPSNSLSPNHISNTESFDADVASLTKAIQAATPKAARTAVRLHWRKCLVGSKGEKSEDTKSDESFLARAILKHGNDHVLKRVVEEYGESLLAHADDATLEKLMKTHGSRLFAAAPLRILDRAIEVRLPTVDAKALVKMLAKANRLGYSESDVVENEQDGVMSYMREITYDSDDEVMEVDPPSPRGQPRDTTAGPRPELPSLYFAPPLPDNRIAINPLPLPSNAPPIPAAPQITLASRSKVPNHVPGSKHVCVECGASFTQSAGLRYHTVNKVCTKNNAKAAAMGDKFVCERCNQGFTNRKGWQYHTENNVCLTHETAKATPHPGYVGSQQQIHPQSQNPSYYVNGTNNGTPPGYHPNPQSSQQPPPNQHPPHHHPHPQPSAYYPPSLPLPFQQLPRGPPHTYPSQYVPHPPYQPPPSAQQNVPPHIQQSQYNPNVHSHPQQGSPQNYPDFRITTGNPTGANSTPVRQDLPTNNRSPPSGPQLDEATLQQMNSKLAKELERYENKLKEIPENLTAIDRDEEVQKIKRGHATRKSMIRKAYGIQVRKSKLRPANAATTPEGGLDMSVLSSRSVTPSSGPSFAPINRLEAFRAPAKSSSSPLSGPPLAAHGRPGPPLEGSESKRRRYDESSDSSSLRIVDYIPKPPKPSSGASDKVRQPLPSGTDVDPAVAARVQDIIERNKPSEPPAEVSRPTSASSSSTSAVASDTLPPIKVPFGAAQRRWETLRRPKPSDDVADDLSRHVPFSPSPLDTPTSTQRSESTESIASANPSVEKKAAAKQVAKKQSVEKRVSAVYDSSSSSDDEDIPAKRPTPSKTLSRSMSNNAGLNTKVSRSGTPGRSLIGERTSPLRTTRATAKA